MYPVGAAGGLHSIQKLGQKILSGSVYSYFTTSGTAIGTVDVFGCTNLLSNGDALYAYGAPLTIAAGIFAQRLGVTTNSGGNVATIFPGEYGVVVSNIKAGQDGLYTLLYNGEAIYRGTDPTVDQLGSSKENFTTLAAGTITFSNAGTTVVGVGTTFTTASLTAAGKYPGYVGNLPSDTLLRPGDIIKVQNTAGTLFSYHRITVITDATHLTVTPAFPFAGAAVPYTLMRTGYGSWSNVVTIFDGSGNYYNYYAGNTLNYANVGTIECFTRPLAGGSEHFMAPQTVTAGGANVADIKAVDIAYYKGFLLYGARGAISWSVAGFPTSLTLTAPFGATDFPAANISGIDNGDLFFGFQWLGDQLIALFEKSAWEIRATGIVPEFEFFKLPEPVGVLVNSYGTLSGTPGIPNSVGFNKGWDSGRNAIYYWSNNGLMELSGGLSQGVSEDVNQALQTAAANENPVVTWEPTTDSVWIYTKGTNPVGFVYNVPTKTWSYFLPKEINGSGAGCNSFTGNGRPNTPHLALIYYSLVTEEIKFFDGLVGGPYDPTGSAESRVQWIWATPVIGLGDEYGAFPMAGFQLDGNFLSDLNWDMYAGRTPYAMTLVKSGKVENSDSRRLMGPKMDVDFVAFVFTSNGVQATYRPVINGLNIYPYGRGK
jgi:hypothetical protein